MNYLNQDGLDLYDGLLKTKLAEITSDVSDLNKSIEDVVEIKSKISYTSGYYIATASDVGETIALTPAANASWEYALLNCSSGDKFSIKGKVEKDISTMTFRILDTGMGIKKENFDNYFVNVLMLNTYHNFHLHYSKSYLFYGYR